MPFLKNIALQKLKTAVSASVQYSLWGWGDGTFGQTNNGILTYVPYQIDSGTTWVSGSGGGSHTVAIKSDGTLWAWGRNAVGQIGDNSVTIRSSPVQIGTLTNWANISGGNDHTIAIKSDGTLWAWGLGTSGQLGDNSSISKSSPVQIGTLTNWSKISAGNSHSMSIKSDGTLWGWGQNASGQLGNLNVLSVTSPVQIGTLTNWLKISAGANNTMAIKTDGTLWAWGTNANGELGNEPITPTRLNLDSWSDTDAGYSYTMGIKSNGTLWGWGLGTSGQLGITIPIQPVQIGTENYWSDVASGRFHTLLVKTDGTLWSWGLNSNGELGLGNTVSRSSPVQVGTLNTWSKVFCGPNNSYAIKTDGTLWAWGRNNTAQLGVTFDTVSRSSPVQVYGGTADWLKVKSGGDWQNDRINTVGLKTNGTIWTWGWGGSGESGNNNAVTAFVPIQVGSLTSWTDVATGGAAVYGVRTDGTIWAWGANLTGQLGQNDTINRSSPVQIGTLTNWSKVFSGGGFAGGLPGHALAIKTDGTLWGWGKNDISTNGRGAGVLGDGTVSSKSSPVQIGVFNNWSYIDTVRESFMGYATSFGIKTDGTLWAWGGNDEGQMGIGTINTGYGSYGSLSPIQVGSESNWSKVSYGELYATAIKTDGTLWGWGLNSSGQLGLNNTLSYNATGYSSPTQVGTINTWSKVSTANVFTIGRRTDGTLWSWGNNSLGQLGLSDIITRSSPVQIGTRTDWSSNFSSFNSHTMAIDTSGSLYGWGLNTTGELGNEPITPTRLNLDSWSDTDAGYSYTMGIKSNGTLWSWGNDTNGESGIKLFYSLPRLIDNNTNWATASGPGRHMLAIKTDGTLWAWGDNTFGQIGDITTISRSSPVQIGTLTNWSKVAIGGSHSMAIKTDGTLWGWGWNSTFGAVGDGTSVNKSSPVQIGTRTGWYDISCGVAHTIATRTDGTLWGWGYNNVAGNVGDGTLINRNSPVQIGTLTNWLKVSATNGSTSMAIKTDGTLWGWGANEAGQLGDGTVVNRSSPVQIGTLTNWSIINSSRTSSYAIKTDGTLWAWGLNSTGQLGLNDTISRSSPVQVGTLTNWASMSAYGSTLAIKTDGTLWYIGGGTYSVTDGAIITRSSPVQISTLTNWASLPSSVAAINTSGNLYVWGDNSLGQLGTNNLIGTNITVWSSPVQIGTDTNWSKISTANAFTIGRRTDGTLWSWGINTTGQLGLGDISSRWSPTQIGTRTDWTSNFSSYNSHSMAITTGGSLWGWGGNTNGELGQTNVIPRSSPVQVGTLTNWSTVSTGGNHTLSVKTDGTLWGWGINTSGQVGDSSAVSRSSPVQIGTLTNWSKVSAGLSHSMSVKTDGTLWAWGGDGSGELGIRPIQPTQLGTETNWSTITTSVATDALGTAGERNTSFSIKTDGTLWTWGYNGNGQLGLDDVINRSSPVQVGTLANWSKISIASNHSTNDPLNTAAVYAIKTDGTLWAWGDDASIPITSSPNRSSPVQIGTLTNWLELSAFSVYTGGATRAGGGLSIKTDGTLWGWGSNDNGQLGIGTTASTFSPVQIGTLTNWYKLSNNNSGPHSLSIKTDGTLWAWGTNVNGQLGDGTIISRSSPVQIGTDTNWSIISGGANHTVSLKTNGTLWIWGTGGAGQIGDGVAISRSSPVQIGTLTDWSTVSAGTSYTMAIKTDGTLWGWGLNTSGQLGNGTLISRSSPIQIGTNTNWSKVSAGRDYTIAINTSGVLYSWGRNNTGELGSNNTIGGQTTSISSPVQVGTLNTWSDVWATANRTYATRTDGTLWGWGAATNYLGDTITFPTTPTTRYSPVQIGTKTNWSEIGRGQNHIAALKTDGTMWGWGINTYAQLGLNFINSNTSRSSPVQIGDDTFWSKISTGQNHTLSVKTDGTLWGWGLGTSGQIGDSGAISRSYPVQVGTLTNWSKVSAGTSHSMSIKTDGTLWAWGGDGSGELGIRPIQPTLIDNNTNWSSASVAASHTISIKNDGTLWTWGNNATGQLGDGTTISRSSPVQVGTLSNWSKIYASQSHCMAIKTDGTLWGWGTNPSGQLAQNDTIDRSSPVQIGTDTNWLSVSAGINFSIALKTNGTLWSWGLNNVGQLGQNNTINRSSPVQIGTDTNWSVISSIGDRTTLAIKTDGTMWGWGLNSQGNIGDNTIIGRSSPVQIGTDTNWLKVECSSNYTLALKTNGTLWAWGNNGNGQLGDNTLTSKSSPIQIGTDADWSKIFAGAGYSTATKTNGTLWGWGVNTSGQLGDGTLVSKSSPVQIGILTNWSIISNGGSHSIAINSSGNLYVWGSNSAGQLGTGTTIGGQTTSLSSPIQVGTLTTWSDVWATNSRTYATKTDGTLWGWGAATNYLGDTLAWNVGFGTFPTVPTTRYSPTQIGTKTNWSEIGRGQNHIIGLKSDGSMLGWGINTNGQLGLNFFGSNTNRSSPVQIGDDTFWSEVSAGGNHTLAVKNDGTLWAWGLGTGGRVGDGQVISRSYPVQIGTLTSWSKVNSNIDHSVAITTSGNLWGWGTNTTGKLGDGTIISRSSPVQLPGSNWKDVKGIGSHSIGISTGGNLYTWGLASSGQLGYTMQRSSPVQIGDGYSWSKIGGGDLGLHTIAITTAGTLWGWGGNGSGQLGDNTVVYRSSPVQIGTLTNWSNINLSISHSMALKTDDTLWGWGRNVSGQIGDGTVIDRSSPVQIGTLTGWSRVSGGGNTDTTMMTMAVRTDGSLWGWGSFTNGKIGIITPVVPQETQITDQWSDISTKGNHTLAIKTNGTLWAWGSNSTGQIGDGTIINRSSPVQIGTLTNWSKVFAGYAGNSFAIKTDGTLWSWGINTSNGGLGLGDVINRSSPVQIGTLTDWSFVDAGQHTIALKTNGTIWGWGQNVNGSVGDGTAVNRSSPVQIGTLTNWSKVTVGNAHTISIKTDGTLWGWGYNVGTGAVGDGTVIHRSSPVQIGTLTNWSKVDAHFDTNLAIKTDGTLWSWGGGTVAQIGDGFSVSRSSPVQIGTLTSWSDVQAGLGHSTALSNNGSIWAWGTNSSGQVGDGTVINRSSPVQIGTLTNWSKLLIGASFSMAINSSNVLYGWGDATFGQTGLNNTITTATTTVVSPARVGLETYWSDLSLGADHGMATKTTGTLWGWGPNGAGQIGDGTVTIRSSPIQIGTLTGWSKISAGASHTMAIYTDGTLWSWGLGTSGQLGNATIIPTWLIDRNGYWSNISSGWRYVTALKTDGTLWAWGANGTGELGDGTVIARSSPVQIGTRTGWSKISSGEFSHTVAVRTDGTIWTWGLNDFGQLGQNNVINRSSPIQIGTLTNWAETSISIRRTFAIKTDGTLWAWGANGGTGGLGDGTLTSRSSPVQLGTLTNWSKVYGGSSHVMAIKTDGTLWGWGTNDNGQVGDGTVNLRNSPVQIGTLTGWSTASAGGSHTMAIKTDGTLWAWGANPDGQLGITLPILPTKLDSGANWSTAGLSSHSMLVKTDGTLWGWGSNGTGELGLNDTINRSSPVQVGTDTNWSNVSANSSFTIAIKSDGTLWSWGGNSQGQLGQNISTAINRSSPVQVGTLTNWSKISIGNGFASAIKTDGTLWAWGQNSSGELGLNNTTQQSSPVQVGTLTNWSSVSAGGNAFCVATKTDGTLWSWGNNTNGELGNGTTISRSSPVQIGTDTNWSKISAGSYVTLSIKTDGTLWGWGGNGSYNQIGDGTGVSKSSPVQVGTLTNWSSVSVGGRVSAAIKTDGTLWTWGGGANAEFGDGDFSAVRNSPVQVGTRTDWKYVFAAGSIVNQIYHVMATDTSNNLYVWGRNNVGQLGINNTISYSSTGYSSPIQVGTLTNWSSVSTQYNTTMAIKTDGTLWGWGRNTNGQLGDGTIVTKSSPIQIGSLTNWSIIDVGGDVNGGHSIGIKTDGTIRGWGTNSSGELGTGYLSGNVSRSSPIQIGDETSWSSVYAGNTFTHAIKTDGTLWGWGINTAGYLGDATILSRSIPIQIGTYSKWTQVSAGASHTIAIRQE